MQPGSHVEERISKCEEILSRNPKSVIFAALSDAYRKKGDLARAFHICGQGLKSHPDYAPGHLVMAKINMERGMYSEAERELALAVRTDGKTRATELLLAQILTKRGQIKGAKKILEKLRTSDPANELIGELLESIRQKEKSDKPSRAMAAVDERWRIEKVADLEDGVHCLKSLPGVIGALVIGEDGSVLESKVKPELDPEVLAAVANSITGCVKNGISDVGFGEYAQILVETGNLQLWITGLKETSLLLCCDPETNMGALRIKVTELLEHIWGNDA